MKVLKSFRRLAAASAVALAIGGAAHADEVNIGFTGPLSGGAALYGENTLEGLR
ncbi:MAG TPA: ethanolamine utilization protein EutJ, partial [Alcanivorax sp.]|nr:ethanolamine utilization protein EutJ [Alcanivorax sp.]